MLDEYLLTKDVALILGYKDVSSAILDHVDEEDRVNSKTQGCFAFEFGEIRVLEIENEPWFVGKDVAEILGYSEPRSAVAKKVDAEDKGVSKMATPSGTQEMTIINESGLYSLILSSKLPNAKKFKRWVTNEVLPSIRKHGAYMTEDTIEKANCQIDSMFHPVIDNLGRRKAERNIVPIRSK